MPDVKNLLFDFGGVLVDLDKARCVAEFAKLGIDMSRSIGDYGQSGFLEKLERGEITVQEFCDTLHKMSGRADTTDGQIIAAWESFLVGVPEERLELILKAKKHYHVYLLSNTNYIHWNLAERSYFGKDGHKVEDYFEKVFLSCDMGMEKPSHEIFNAVVQSIGCKADSIMFFDDSEANCQAARACGLQATHAPANGEWLKNFDKEGCLCK